MAATVLFSFDVTDGASPGAVMFGPERLVVRQDLAARLRRRHQPEHRAATHPPTLRGSSSAGTAGGGWTETVLYNLPCIGYKPNASIVVVKDGALYGTTYYLGSANLSSAFTLAPVTPRWRF